LITQRKLDGLLGGLWEFPGGNKEPGETAEQACVRVMREETGLSVEITAHLTQVKHAYTHFRIVADVFRCRYQSGEVVLKHAIDYRWIPLESLDQFALPKSNHKFIHLLQDSYKL